VPDADPDLRGGDRPLETEVDDVYDVDPELEVLPITYEITSYGADYPVDGLVKRLNQKDVVVPSFDPAFPDNEEVHGFQRRFVWGRPQMDRFVESLLLGLPVPGIFLVRDRTNKLLVLDGQQRLRTLQYFYSGVVEEKRYRLKYAQEPFSGKTYDELDEEDRRRLDDSIIHATVLRQEQPSGSQNAVYSIFERLNTGGSPLQPQEIRVALYHGAFLASINSLNEHPEWRALYGQASKRFKDQELILRVLALFERSDRYERPVKGFLNKYLEDNRVRRLSGEDSLWQAFTSAATVIHEAIGARAFRPVRALNAAVLDSLMVGVMRRTASGVVIDTDAVADAYQDLLANPEYQQGITSSTAAEDSVQARLRLATAAFAAIL
jgi:hypothetical protein